jgi:two-component system chemotaxis sensor kinase CheA
VVVLSSVDRSLGLLVFEIVVMVYDPVAFELASDRPGVLGSAVIKGQATEVIDISHFLPAAFGNRLDRPERHGATRKLLLIDDQAFFRNMLAPILSAAGYAVTTAASAAEALARITGGERFDAVITDLDMPEISGFELAQALRSDPVTAGLPVIGLTAIDAPDTAHGARQAGIRDCVAKFDRAALVAAVGSLGPIERAA